MVICGEIGDHWLVIQTSWLGGFDQNDVEVTHVSVNHKQMKLEEAD